MTNAPPGTDYLSYAPWNEVDDDNHEEPEYNVEDQSNYVCPSEEEYDQIEA